ncbi:integrin alpha-8-like [Glandiceps talaboti]
MIHKEYSLLWILYTLGAVVRAFNIDVLSPVVRSGPDNSMFGFGVSVHRYDGTNWLLVGAPRAQTAQPNVVRGGAVYKCPAAVDATQSCEQIPFDTSGPTQDLNGGVYETMEEKSNQWFGATVKSSGDNGEIVACAPRYVYFTENFRRREPVGVCYTSRSDFSRFKSFSPCKRSSEWGWYALGSCQAGMSADITKDKSFLLIGAPGSYYWQGQIYAEGLLYTESRFNPEGPEEDDNSYAGYAVAVGDFTHDSEDDYAVGVPRGNDLKGMVRIYDAGVRIWDRLYGEQLGSYFGSALCVTDIDNDGQDDVIVGAPYFTEKEIGTEKWEAGRVYVFYQDANYGFGEPDRLIGSMSGARFGTAVVAIGDVNQDGYNDIAVGAPYYGEDKKGAVFIYHGSRNGIRTQISQIVTASDINTNLRTFGSSLAGGLDMDNNQYPDILVGAYSSDNAVLIRSRPVINIEADVNVNPELIDLESRTCARGSDDTPVACFALTTCLRYTGVNVPASIDLELTYVLDTLIPLQKRVSFQSTGTAELTEKWTLQSPNEARDWCRGGNMVLLKEDFLDKYSPIGIDITYKLLTNTEIVPPLDLHPVLNQYIPSTIKKQAYILNDCGEERICVPDLKLEANMDPESIFVGNSDNVRLQVKVSNLGEDAFIAEVTIALPSGIDYVRVENLDETEYVVACSNNPDDNTGIVTCDVGNPLKANHEAFFALTLSTVRVDDTQQNIVFRLTSNSTNEEDPETLEDNNFDLTVPVKVDSVLSFTGVSAPEQVTFNPRNVKLPIVHEENIGPEVTHLYEVRNRGPSSIDGADIVINWPAFTPTGEHLLYLLDVQLQGGSPCVVHGELNPDKLKTKYDMSVTANFTKRSSQVRGMRHRRDESKDSLFMVDCKSAICVKIECSIDFVLKKDASAFVEVRSRLWKDTLLDGGFEDSEITSTAQVQVNSMPYRIQPDSYPGAVVEVTSIAITTKPKARTLPVPIWVIILAIVGGLLILLCIVLVLWKAGFFKRKRVDDKYKENAQNRVNDGMSGYSAVPASDDPKDYKS